MDAKGSHLSFNTVFDVIAALVESANGVFVSSLGYGRVRVTVSREQGSEVVRG